MINVLKRDGSSEEFNTSKVKNVIQWACAGLDVNPLALESRVEELQVNAISTVDIHDSIIYNAQALASAEDTDWVYVAGRLNTMKRWKDTQAYDMEFKCYISDMIESGKYKHPAIKEYTDEELDYLEKHLKQNKDLDHSYGSTLTAEKKYLLEGECIQHMLMVQAMIIFRNKPLDKVLELYKALSNRKVSLATPWLGNLRSKGNISSCFIISIDDNKDSIAEAIKKAINISSDGGGLGIFLGNLRAEGSIIAGRPNSAKSVAQAAKVFNDIAVWFDQGGKRAGAFTPALPIWHNDIDDFLEIQSETGDQRKKAHDIFPQVCVPDLFMKKDKEGDFDWYTFCPFELLNHGLDIVNCYGKGFEDVYYKAVELAESGVLQVWTKRNTRTLLKHIMRTYFETGLPYLAFTDTINEMNPNKHMGIIPCVNLCVEQFAVLNATDYTHTCNLASVVAGRMESYDDFIYYSGLLTEVLNNGIDLTNSPHESSKKHNNDFRTIGIGIQGACDWLIKNNTNYHNVDECTRIAEYIQYGAVTKGIELAKEHGAYPKFTGSDWDTGTTTSRYVQDSVTDLDWDGVQEGINEFGIYNSQFTSPAPNTSTSVFMDAGAGFMPIYSGFFREDNDNGKYPVAAQHIKEFPLGYSYTFRHYDQAVLAKAVGGCQKFVCAGISAEYVLDQNKDGFSAKDLFDLIHAAHEHKTKAVYYVRSIKKGETVDDLLGIKDGGCSSCAD